MVVLGDGKVAVPHHDVPNRRSLGDAEKIRASSDIDGKVRNVAEKVVQRADAGVRVVGDFDRPLNLRVFGRRARAQDTRIVADADRQLIRAGKQQNQNPVVAELGLGLPILGLE